MKRALLVFSLIALFLAGFAGWLERAVKTSLIEDQNKPFLPSKTGCFEAQNNPSSSEVRCGNVEYALFRDDTILIGVGRLNDIPMLVRPSSSF